MPMNSIAAVLLELVSPATEWIKQNELLASIYMLIRK